MKGIWVLAVVCAFVAGSLVTGAAVFADPDDDDELSSLLCPIGQAMTGILFEDDDEILDVICDIAPVAPASLDVIVVRNLVLEQGGPSIGASATCPPDRVLVGGGGSYDSIGKIFSFSLEPDESTPNQFNATVRIGPENVDRILAISVAFCAKLVP